MWLELAGAAALWLAHSLGYAAAAKRGRALGLEPARTRPALRAAALLLASVGSLFWMRQHGPALGACSTLAALIAAASVNAIVAPLAARSFWALSALSATALVIGIGGWLSGA